MLNKVRAHRRKRGPLPKREDIPLLDTSVATEFVKSIKKHWPKVHEKLKPHLEKGKEKLGDAYASVATVLAQQKEAFEDRRAEKKEKERVAKHRPTTRHPKTEKNGS